MAQALKSETSRGVEEEKQNLKLERISSAKAIGKLKKFVKQDENVGFYKGDGGAIWEEYKTIEGTALRLIQLRV